MVRFDDAASPVHVNSANPVIAKQSGYRSVQRVRLCEHKQHTHVLANVGKLSERIREVDGSVSKVRNMPSALQFFRKSRRY